MTTPRIVSHPNAKPSKKRKWIAALGLNSLSLSILFHVVFGVGATYLIVESFHPKHINFHATAPSTHTEVEHKVELAKKNNVESAPPDLKRIVTTGVSSIVLPDVPEVPQQTETSPTSISGVDGVMGSGSGGGNGTGGNGLGIPSSFGTPDGVGLEGTLYDLKQTPDRKPTPIAATGAELNDANTVGGWENLPATLEGLRVLRNFVKDWNIDILNRYYKAPAKLVATQFFIPRLESVEAPKAFHVEATVQARRWVAYYHAKIVPPKSGEFRFIGHGDDVLVVRVDGRNVLDGCSTDQILDDTANDHDDVGSAAGYTGMPLGCGKWIQMEAGTPMDMEVLIGEGPGGESSFFLFIQEKGVETAKGDYPLFQLKDVPVPTHNDPLSVPPAFTGKKMVFGVGALD